ncbi:DUF6816 family protein [Kovacikia minuta]|uniref:DUF6816 family protein n=1 Tax=Kovacikia minuta TaxID=2931930 RepID=UPI0036F3F098
MGVGKRNFVARFICFWLVFWFWGIGAIQAASLADRVAIFPQWESKPALQSAEGDLAYPDWFKGTWKMTSTLVELVAPLAPEIVTPGFESNRQYLNQPIATQVRFVPANALAPRGAGLPLSFPLKSLVKSPIVADRRFNGLNLARAYLGDRAVLSVTVDPSSPNRQITTLPEGRELISVVVGRAVEAPNSDQFITTELFQQVFRGMPQPYLNQVETTTAYYHQPTESSSITAEQMTAIYLSPQDPLFFKSKGDLTQTVGDRPIALYRYRLELTHEIP